MFLGHGLVAAFFAATAVIAAAALWRTQARLFRLPLSGITAYLATILILCKSWARSSTAFCWRPWSAELILDCKFASRC